MNNIHFIIPCIALILAVVAICRPTWPLLAVAVILLAIDLMVKSCYGGIYDGQPNTMKILKLAILSFILSLAIPVMAQNVYVTNSVTGAVAEYAPVVATTNAPASGWLNSLKYIGTSLSSATNYSANIYGTYAPSAPKPKVQFGAGVLLIYDVSSHVGVAAGIDYLGSWSMFSGNATFKLPMEPLAGWGLTNLVMTPNAIVGLGTSMSGAGSANGSVTTIAGLGDSFAFGHWLGGNFDLGAEAVNISGAGAYSGWDYRLFFGWTKGF